MMFSSNQKLMVSGPLRIEYIVESLKFAFKLSGQDQHLTKEEYERGCLFTYQITDLGSFCVGWGFEDVPRGWEQFSFDFDYEIVARIIKQKLESGKFSNVYEGSDGTVKKGFLMRDISDSYEAEEKRDIKNSFYGIVEFEPYTVYYAK